jgi:hypothetical protein
VWVPGDPQGNAGAIRGAKYPGRNPRPLLTLAELFYVEITGVFASNPEDELKQYEATRTLYDAWIRAVYKAAHGTFAIVSSNWLIEHNIKRYGATMRVVCAIEAMIPDSPLAVAAGTAAALQVSELDVTEEVDIASPLPSDDELTDGTDFLTDDLGRILEPN